MRWCLLLLHINVVAQSTIPDIDPLQCVQPSPKHGQISLSHLEGKGIGFDQGYSSLDLFFSHAPHGTREKAPWLLFFDLRGHLFNNARGAVNLGMGARCRIGDAPWMGGVNLFYDVRGIHHADFHQVGVGLEAAAARWDLHCNGYFPVNTRTHHTNAGFVAFQGHTALFFQHSALSFTGSDLRLGYILSHSRLVQLHAMATGYYLTGPFNQHAKGAQLQLRMQITPYLTLEGSGSYDSLFHARGAGTLSLCLPFGRKGKVDAKRRSCTNECLLLHALQRSARRFEIIPVGHHTQYAVATNQSTNQPLLFVFVDNQRGSSDGSFASPYRTLSAAQANSSPGNVIYLFSGDGTTSGMDMGIVLQDNQLLVGSSVPLTVNTPFGALAIPAQTAISPTLTNTTGNVVTLANNNSVLGLNIQVVSPFNGINATNITNATIRQLRSFGGNNTSHSFDILMTATGTVTLQEVQLSSIANNNLSLNLYSYAVASITNSTMTNGFNVGLSCSALSGANVRVGIANCSLFGTPPNSVVRGAILGADPSSTMVTEFRNNVIHNTTGPGVGVLNQSTAYFFATGNLIQQPAASGGAGPGMLLSNESTDTLVSDVENNVVLNAHQNRTPPSSNAFPAAMEFYNKADGGTSIIRLLHNTAFTYQDTAPGYSFSNIVPKLPPRDATFFVQSLDGTLSGVAALNVGSSAAPFDGLTTPMEVAGPIYAVPGNVGGSVQFIPLQPLTLP